MSQSWQDQLEGSARRLAWPTARLDPLNLLLSDIMGHAKLRVELSILPAAPLRRRFFFDGVIVVAEYGDHDGSYSACKGRIKHRADQTPGAGSPVACRKPREEFCALLSLNV